MRVLKQSGDGLQEKHRCVRDETVYIKSTNRGFGSNHHAVAEKEQNKN